MKRKKQMGKGMAKIAKRRGKGRRRRAELEAEKGEERRPARKVPWENLELPRSRLTPLQSQSQNCFQRESIQRVKWWNIQK